MAQDFFILNSAGDFATPANWTSGVPTSTEDAEIDSAGGFAVSTASETVNSIGTDSGDGLLIGGGVFVVADGTGPEENEGSISVVDASLAMEDGTFVNPGVLSLAGYNSSNVGTLLITDSVELAGSGQVAMTIGGGPSANTIEGFSFVEVPTLTNDNDTVSGDGTILGLNFINTAGGLIETNNSSSTSGGDMQIEGSAGGGSFTNDGFMEINNGGEFVFGVSGDTTIDNDGSIIFQGANKLTRLAVIGVVTISAAGDGGRIELGDRRRLTTRSLRPGWTPPSFSTSRRSTAPARSMILSFRWTCCRGKSSRMCQIRSCLSLLRPSPTTTHSLQLTAASWCSTVRSRTKE